jgi:hypothetical protein
VVSLAAVGTDAALDPRPEISLTTNGIGLAPADSGDDPDVDDVHRCCLIIDFVQDPDVA